MARNFSITGSPQEFTFNNLPADGNTIGMSAFFTAVGGCSFEDPTFFTAPIACCTNLRFEDIDPDLEQFTITNYGTCSEDFGAFRISSNGDTFQFLNNLTVIDGDLFLDPNESVTLQWDVWNPDPLGSNLGLFIQGGSFTSTDDIIDYARWGNSELGGESVAVGAGIWGTDEFINAGAPYFFIGSPSEFGAEFWSGGPLPCAIESISVNTVSECVFSSQSFSAELEIVFSSNPTTGSLDVNGQLFPIAESPMTVVLTGLDANGSSINVTALFTSEEVCTLTVQDLITAPEACPCLADLSGDGLVTINDLTTLLSFFGCTSMCEGDLTGDGIISTADITTFLGAFGTSCP